MFKLIILCVLFLTQCISAKCNLFHLYTLHILVSTSTTSCHINPISKCSKNKPLKKRLPNLFWTDVPFYHKPLFLSLLLSLQHVTKLARHDYLYNSVLRMLLPLLRRSSNGHDVSLGRHFG